jgi:transcription elongation GreA/GreB family factor
VQRFERMPTFRVSIVNEHFVQSAEQQASDVVDAWQQAIRAAVVIASDQVSHGNPFFGAEVTLEEGNKQVGRYVVSVGATPLKD